MKKLLLIACIMNMSAHKLHAAAGSVQTIELQKSTPSLLHATLEAFARDVLPRWKQDAHGVARYEAQFQQGGRVQSSIAFDQRKSGAHLAIVLPGQTASFTLGNLWMQYEDKLTIALSALLQLQYMTTRKQIFGRIADYLNSVGNAEDMIVQAHYDGEPGSLQEARKVIVPDYLNNDSTEFLNRVHYAPITKSDRINITSLSDIYDQEDDDQQSVVVGKYEPLSEIRSLSDLMN